MKNEPLAQSPIRILRRGCSELGLEITEAEETALMQHLGLLQKWNRTHNLTAITDTKQIVVQHLLDSLSILPYIKGTNLLDVGTGGGFPGLPIAVCRSALSVTLLDSRGKRMQFLQHCRSSMRLPNLSLENRRIEKYQPNVKFDTLTARAFTSLANMVGLCRHCLNSGSRLLAMKGSYPHEELDLFYQFCEEDQINCQQVTVRPLEVPYLDARRHLVIIEF